MYFICSLIHFQILYENASVWPDLINLPFLTILSHAGIRVTLLICYLTLVVVFVISEVTFHPRYTPAITCHLDLKWMYYIITIIGHVWQPKNSNPHQRPSWKWNGPGRLMHNCNRVGRLLNFQSKTTCGFHLVIQMIHTNILCHCLLNRGFSIMLKIFLNWLWQQPQQQLLLLLCLY